MAHKYGPGQAPTTKRIATIDDFLSDKDRELMRMARSADSESALTMAQQAHTMRLQKALRSLPLEVILNHVSIALDERSDFDLEQAQRFASMVNDKVWSFY
jgi:hypothetical protein